MTGLSYTAFFTKTTRTVWLFLKYKRLLKIQYLSNSELNTRYKFVAEII